MVGTAALAIASPASSTARSGRPLPLRQHRHDDRSRDNHSGNAVRDVVRDEGETQELDDHRANERAENGGATAGERSSSHRDSRDGVELHVLSDPVWISGAIDSDNDQPRETRQKSADAV